MLLHIGHKSAYDDRIGVDALGNESRADGVASVCAGQDGENVDTDNEAAAAQHERRNSSGYIITVRHCSSNSILQNPRKTDH